MAFPSPPGAARFTFSPAGRTVATYVPRAVSTAMRNDATASSKRTPGPPRRHPDPGGMSQQLDPAVGQVRNECVFVSVHIVDARYFHSADAGSGQSLELGSKIRAIERAAHPPPARPRLGFGGRRGPRQGRGLSHGDLRQEKQRKKRPRPHPLSPSPCRRGGTSGVPPLPEGEGARG